MAKITLYSWLSDENITVDCILKNRSLKSFFFPKIRLGKFILFAFSSTDQCFFPNLLLMVEWKDKDFIISLFSFLFLLQCATIFLVIVTTKSFRVIFFLFLWICVGLIQKLSIMSLFPRDFYLRSTQQLQCKQQANSVSVEEILMCLWQHLHVGLAI